jgi:hypothetical protein
MLASKEADFTVTDSSISWLRFKYSYLIFIEEILPVNYQNSQLLNKPQYVRYKRLKSLIMSNSALSIFWNLSPAERFTYHSEFSSLRSLSLAVQDFCHYCSIVPFPFKIAPHLNTLNLKVTSIAFKFVEIFIYYLEVVRLKQFWK